MRALFVLGRELLGPQGGGDVVRELAPLPADAAGPPPGAEAGRAAALAGFCSASGVDLVVTECVLPPAFRDALRQAGVGWACGVPKWEILHAATACRTVPNAGPVSAAWRVGAAVASVREGGWPASGAFTRPAQERDGFAAEEQYVILADPAAGPGGAVSAVVCGPVEALTEQAAEALEAHLHRVWEALDSGAIVLGGGAVEAACAAHLEAEARAVAGRLAAGPGAETELDFLPVVYAKVAECLELLVLKYHRARGLTVTAGAARLTELRRAAGPPALDALDSGAGEVSMFRGAAAIVHYVLNLECSIVHRHPPG